MIRKCPKCKQFKELDDANFRFMPKQDRYCAYCRPCEARYTRERRQKQRKVRFINTFLNLTKDYSEADVDRLFIALKTSWRAKHAE